jgi:uncharacterized membrane protein
LILLYIIARSTKQVVIRKILDSSYSINNGGDNMTEIKHSIKIYAPVDKIFQYASDYQKWPEFYNGVSDVKPITETTHDQSV